MYLLHGELLLVEKAMNGRFFFFWFFKVYILLGGKTLLTTPQG